MKQYILKLRIAALCLVGLGSVQLQAQNAVSDSTNKSLIDLPFGQLPSSRVVGSVDVINADDIMHYGGARVSGAMEGQSVGYVWSRIRGYSRNGADAPLIIIDGLSNRNLGSITMEEVESIHILKDVTAKMLYGSRAANGVILVKTKRGSVSDRKVSFTAEYGLKDVEFYPNYVNGVEYMKFRNQALLNDGKTQVFTQDQIDNSGTSYNYPNVDYYDTFAKDQTSMQTINGQLTGGTEKTQYFLNIGYVGSEGLEKVGDGSRTDALNVRSNLDFKVNDVLSVNMDIAARMFIDKKGHYEGNMFSRLSSTKPTDYPLFISQTPHIDSLGTSDIANGTNLYGDLVYSGYQSARTTLAQTNFGLNFNLNKYITGLTAKAYGNFDMNNVVSIGKKLSYRTLKPNPKYPDNSVDPFVVYGTSTVKGQEQTLWDTYYRNMGGGAYLDYDRTTGKHAVKATANFMFDLKTIKTADVANEQQVQDDKGMNFGGRLNYAYDKKYVLELTTNYMGSNRFHEDNRWKLFGAAGAAWVISEEDFMKDNGVFNYLKAKASYGSIGYDQSFGHLLYQDFYKYWSGSYKTGNTNGAQLVGTEFSQTGNKDLTFEVSTELNLGLEGTFLNDHLYFAGEYYKEERTGMPTLMKFNVPQMSGNPNYIDNYNEISTTGVEISLQYTNKVGDFDYSFGGTLTSYESVFTKLHEQNDFAFRNREGYATDSRWGYVADGFYTSQEDIDTYGAENGIPLTNLTRVLPGDLKLKDLSDEQSEYNIDDNAINYYDTKEIGNYRPRYMYTLNLDLRYKNLSFYAMGQGFAGYDIMLNQSYFTNKGNVNYSKHAYDAAVPTFDAVGNATGIENPNFTRPRLTTEGSTQSYSTNTFWQEKGGYFRLSTVDINYKLPETVARTISASQVNVYVRGNNLYTWSKVEDLNPANLGAGISGSPMMRTILFGVKLGF